MTGPSPASDKAALTEAVSNTEGFQPWRRLFHAVNGTLMVGAIAVLGLPVPIALVILGIALALAVLVDAVRLFDPKANTLFFRAFASLASPREARHLASSTWYVLSALIVLMFFPKPYALAGILVLGWADPAANVVGQLWGRRPFLQGTVLGTLAFSLAAFLALILFVPWPAALAVAAITAILEATPTGLDDNLLVPLVVAAALSLLSL